VSLIALLASLRIGDRLISQPEGQPFIGLYMMQRNVTIGDPAQNRPHDEIDTVTGGFAELNGRPYYKQW